MHALTLSPGLRSFTMFLLLLIVYLSAVEYLIQHTSFARPLQLLETNIVASTQSAFGINVYADGYNLFYPGNTLQLVIGPLCTGIREMFLFAIVILPFGAISMRRKLKSLAIFLPAILVENILRLWALYPLASAHGFRTMGEVHDLIWTYGQIAVLVGLLFIWFYLFAGLRPVRRTVKERGAGGQKKHRKKAKV